MNRRFAITLFSLITLGVSSSTAMFAPAVDGALTVAAANTILNQYTTLTGNAAVGATSITVASAAALTSGAFGALAAGDQVLIIQMQGATIDTTDTVNYGNVTALNNAGHFEMLPVLSVAGNVINIDPAICSGLRYAYSTAGATQVVRVPQFSSLTVNAGASITAPAWNGATGGIIALHVQGTATLNGPVSVSGLGFRGGIIDTTNQGQTTDVVLYRSTLTADGGEKGESIAGSQATYDGLNGRYGRGAPANAGGGGNSFLSGGGGGSNGNKGGTWLVTPTVGGQGVMDGTVTGAAAWTLDPGYIANGNALTNSPGGGRGGYSGSVNNRDALVNGPGDNTWNGNNRQERGGLGGHPMANDPLNRLFFGGGGGSGTAKNSALGSGGAGGGIVILYADTVTGTSSISASGANGENSTTGSSSDGAGGAGGGGSIVVYANTLNGVTLNANGGTGGTAQANGNSSAGPGGGGGGGYIAVFAGAPTRNAIGGDDGISNSGSLTEFPANGATDGAAGQSTASATICPGAYAGIFQFSGATYSFAENGGSVIITVTRTGGTEGTVSVNYATVAGGSAGAGADYTTTSGTLTFLNGQNSKTFSIPILDDFTVEGSETVNLQLSLPLGGTLGPQSTAVLTITDDESAATVQWTSAAQSSVNESGVLTVTAQLSAILSQDVTVPFTLSGTAASPADYTITASPLTITAGTLSANATITIVGDGTDEPNETVILTMGVPTNAAAGATTVHTATITDDDNPPSVQWTALNQSSVGEAGVLVVTAQLSAVSGKDVTIPFTVGGTASNPADYTITASPLTILAGALNATATITIAGDALDENNETVSLTIGVPTNATVGATNIHTATITDDDAAPVVQWTLANQASINETGVMTVTAQLSAVSGLDVTLPFTVGGTASNPADYSITASPLQILAGATTANITITIAPDFLAEGAETVIVTFGVAVNATVGATNIHTATITDDEGPPTVQWTSAAQASAGESGVMTVTAQLSSTAAVDVTVPFVVSGTAANPADYTISASPLTILAGNLTASATITIAADTTDENNETVILTMGVPTNATAGGTTVHTATITDNDAPPVVQWTAPAQASVGEAGVLQVTAQLSAISELDVTIPFVVTGTASNPADYTITAGPLMILAGALNATATITIAGDAVDESNETVILTLGAPTNATVGGTNIHTATITDDDAAPVVQWTAPAQASVGEAGALIVTAQLSAISELDVTLPFTVGGTASNPADYTITGGPLTILAGNLSATATITIVGDPTDEPDETVILTLGVPVNATVGATSIHTATITDDDAAPSVQWSSSNQASAGEAGPMTVTAELSAASGFDITVPFVVTGTASNPADYTITAGPLTIFAGNLSATATITIVGDPTDEPDETVILTMGAPGNAAPGVTTVHTATITDDDAQPTVQWTLPAQASAGEAGVMTVTAQLSAASGFDITLPFSVGGTASDPADYSITVSPLTILAGATTSTVTITIAPDAVDEPNETVILTLGVPTNATPGATTLHTATITDDDLPTATFTAAAQTALETAGTMTITVQLSSLSGVAVDIPFTLGGTATNPSDYTITASPLTIPAGSPSGTITITLTDNIVGEPSETVIVTMGAPVNATAGGTTVHTATITDDDTPGFTVNPVAGLVTTEAGAQATFTIVLNTQPTADVTIGLSSSNVSEGTVNPPSLTFTNVNWNVARIVTITGVNDLVADGDTAYTIITAPAVSADGGYTGLNPTDVSVTNTSFDGGLSAILTVLPAAAPPGSTVTFTLALANAGPKGAANVSAAFPLPPGLSFVNAVPSQGAYDSSTGLWTVGALAATGTATMTVDATVSVSAGGTAIDATASVGAATGYDPDISNNQSTATVAVSVADLVIECPGCPAGVAGADAPVTLAPATVGSPFTVRPVAAGGLAGFAWSIVSSTPAFPLNLDPISGLISGTPTAAGTFTFTLGVTDAQLPADSDVRPFTIIVSAVGVSPPDIQDAPAPPDGAVGVAYVHPFVAFDGVPPYTWQVTAGVLPPGLALNALTGEVAGIPSASGTFDFCLEVTAQNGPCVPDPGCLAGEDFSITIDPSPLSIVTASLPPGSIGSTYDHLVVSRDGVGPTYAWSVAAGALPPGLSLSGTAASVLLTGTPTTPGAYVFTLRVDDNGQAGVFDRRAYVVNVAPPAILPLRITTAFLPPGSINQAYTAPLSAAGGQPPLAWSITAGALPGGLSLDPVTGEITGTPLVVGTFQVTFQAVDNAATAVTRTLTLVISPLPAITTASPLSTGMAGTGYSAILGVVGGTAPYAWDVLPPAGPETGLPGGVSLSPTGMIFGSPLAAGSYLFTVRVTDAPGATDTKQFALTIVPPAPPVPVVLTVGAPEGTAGTPYSTTLQGLGGTLAYSWSVIAGAVPPGLVLDPVTGAVSGTPAASGTFVATYRLTDNAALTASSPAISIHIVDPLSVLTTALPSGVPGSAYGALLTATGGDGPYLWTLVTGTLPPGVTFDPLTGALSGQIDDAGSWPILFQVTDSDGRTSSRSLTISSILPAAFGHKFAGYCGASGRGAAALALWTLAVLLAGRRKA